MSKQYITDICKGYRTLQQVQAQSIWYKT